MVRVSKDWNRRKFLKYGSTTAIGAMVAGCVGGGNSDSNNSSGNGNFPNERMRLVIPFSQGGGTDTVNRTFIPILSEKLGVNIQIDNVPGAASMRGTGQVINQAEPDGYTFLAFNPPSTPISYLVHQPNFDLQSVKGVASYAIAPAVVTVNPDVAEQNNITDYESLISAYQNGTLTDFAGQSIGSYFHAIALLLKQRHGLEWQNYVSYDGTGPAVEAVAAGEAPAGIGIDNATVSFTQSDRLRVPLILTSEGSPIYPDTPTVPDLGYDQMDFIGQVTRCYWAPPETPDGRIETLAQSVEETVNDPAIQDYSETEGTQLFYNGPEYANQLLDEVLNTLPEELDMQSIREQVN